MSNPVFARLYSNLLVKGMDRQGVGELRDRLLADLAGTVVEVGAGDGANFAHYPAAVEQVVAVEPDPYLRARAAARAGERITVLDGDAGNLPVEAASADAVVFCLVLCSVPDQRAALDEARRVLKPGGRLVVLEHVQAPEEGLTRRVQRALDATVWPHLFGGCHVGRDTAAAIEAAGFGFTALERFAVPEGSRLPMSPALLGTAVLP